MSDALPKVFIVLRGDAYYGTKIIAVFANYDDAYAMVQDLNSRNYGDNVFYDISENRVQ